MSRKRDFVLLLSEDESYLVELDGKDFNNKNGLIKYSEIRRGVGSRVKTHLGKEFTVVKPTIMDILRKGIKRTAQIMSPKDISLILAYTGISSDGLVVDAGTGTGYTAIFLANYLKGGKIVSYEKDNMFIKNAKRNIEVSGLGNIHLKAGDVTRRIDEKNVDLVVFDLQDANKAVENAYNSLVFGGYLVVYSPTDDHLMKSVNAVKKAGFVKIVVVENIVREWQAELTLRPKTIGLMHTGFLTFARKVI